jgi:hypothetical protein
MAQYSNTVSFQAPSDFGVETQANDRQRKLAEAMMMRSMQPQAAGQMVGNQYVPQSWTQGLANAVQGPAAMYMQKQADEKAKDIATRQREAYAKELTDFAKLSQGTPAQPEATGNNPSAYTPPQAAVPGDRQAALAMALGAQNPQLQQYGISQLMPKTPEWALGERFNAQTGQPEKFMYNKNDPSQMQAIGGQQAVKGTAINGQLVNPATGTFIGGAVPKQLEPDSVVTMGPGGVLAPNVPVIAAKSQIAREGKPVTNVKVSTEKGYAGEIAKGLAGQDLAAIDAARNAGDRIRTAQSVKSLLEKSPITGTGAEARLALNKALTTAGLIDGTQVRDTETLAGLLASSTLDAIKTSGLGGGQGFTDKDRQFLERARSGNLEVNPATLRDLADLNERAARASIQRGKTVAKRLQGNPSMGTVGQEFNFDEPPVQAPKQQPGGARFLGFEGQ